MIMRPLGDRVLIRPTPSPTQTASGLALVRREPETSGVVIAIGRMLRRSESVMVGDTVVFSAYVGQEVTIDDTRYLLLRATDVAAVLEDPTYLTPAARAVMSYEDISDERVSRKLKQLAEEQKYA